MNKTECQHRWHFIEKIELFNGDSFLGRTYKFMCDKCGETKEITDKE